MFKSIQWLKTIHAYLNETFEAFAVFLLEGNFDVSQVALGPRNDRPDESFVVGACACHAVVQPLGKVDRAVGHALDNCQQASLDRAGKLVTDDLFEGHSMRPVVGLENFTQVWQTA